MLESRKRNTLKSMPLPLDYVRMVNEVFTSNFDAGLKALKKVKSSPARFHIAGQVYADEVLLCISLLYEDQLSSTSVYASSDFDPKASSPTVQDVLAACVDAIGAVFGQLMEPDNLENLADESLSALEDIPFEWTPVTVEKHKIFVRVDKANPLLDQMTDAWLEKNDPDYKERTEREQRETEELFFTGPKDRMPGASSGTAGSDEPTPAGRKPSGTKGRKTH